ncbi:MAG: CinA family protein [Thiomonas sp.]|uniref:CinA family protein n=1 Tax=Thiomonas sp. TaxID=2047785 RepID=UPI002A366DAB|nr:CinA family protein [Thiomonas sp.]MDY0330587.1 CinA family protein [Thiomonas sp.]
MTPLDLDTLCRLAEGVGAAYRLRGWRLATAESCTGGLVSAALTSVAGSSDWFDRGFVTYSNAAKSELLGVDPALFAQVGAVSPEVARAMAIGARQRAGVEVAVAITGIAGPGGGTPQKPVGTVWFGLAWGAGDAVHGETRHALFEGDRARVRLQAAELALRWLLQTAQPT